MTLNKTVYYTVKILSIEDGWRNADYYRMYIIIDNELLSLRNEYLGGWDTIKTDDELVQDYLNEFKPEYSKWEIKQL